MLVGAPKANSSFINKANSKDKQSGTVFKCDVASPSLDCDEQVPFDESGKFLLSIFMDQSIFKSYKQYVLIMDFIYLLLPYI